MPFYEYKCDRCGHQFEVMQRITAEPILDCERCHAPVRRVIFPSAIVYKGSGFYSTEYGRSRFNNPNSKSSDDKRTGDDRKSGEGGGSETSSSPPAPSSTQPSTSPSGPASSAAPTTAAGDGGKPATPVKAASGNSAS